MEKPIVLVIMDGVGKGDGGSGDAVAVAKTDVYKRQMVEDLKQYKGKSGSSCPNVGEWLEAFGDAEEVFCITISKHLSGSYNAARHAADTYMSEHPARKVFIFDSLATGPEMMMLAEKIRQCEDAGDDFETTKEKVLDYHNHLHTLFCLESMNNLARNGRDVYKRQQLA